MEVLRTPKGAFNPSIIKYKKGYLLSYRIYKSKVHPWNSGWNADSALGLALLDKDFKILSKSEVPIQIDNDLSGPEDCRLFRDSKRRIRIIFNAYSSPENIKIGSDLHRIKPKELYHGMIHLMYTSQIKLRGNNFVASKLRSNQPGFESKPGCCNFVASKAVPVCINQTTSQEKNWSPFVYKGKDYISYFTYPTFYPHKIFTVTDYNTEFCTKEIKNFSGKVPWGPGYRLGGGTPAIPFKGVYLAAGHVVISKGGKSKHPSGNVYALFFYTFNPETGEILKMSSKPIVLAQSITFPMGIIKQGNLIILSYGYNDIECRIKKFTIPEMNLN